MVWEAGKSVGWAEEGEGKSVPGLGWWSRYWGVRGRIACTCVVVLVIRLIWISISLLEDVSPWSTTPSFLFCRHL